VDLSVVIVSWRVREPLRACLRSLEADGFTGEREIWVVDNASGDGTTEGLIGEFPDLNLIENDRNVGFPRAVNQALEKAHGAAVLLLNPDAQVAPGGVQKAFDWIMSTPRAGVVGAAVEREGGEEDPACHRPFPTLWTEVCELTTLWRRFPSSSLLNPWRTLDVSSDAPCEVPCVSGAAMMVRRDLLADLGGLDTTCPMYMEDLELCWRARERGRRVDFHPGFRVLHTGGASASQVSEHVRALNYRARYNFFRRHYGRARAEALRGLVGWAMAGRVAVGAAASAVGLEATRDPGGDCRTLKWAVTGGDAGWSEIGE